MASGDTLAVFTPLHFISPASNGAALDFRNGHPVLDFDPTTEESAVAVGILAANYSGGGITAKYHWMATSATTGDVMWQGAIEAEGTDNDSDSFATAQSASAATTNGTSGIETTTSVAFTSGANMDSLAAGKRFRFKVIRNADDASDTMSGDAELTAVELVET